MFRKRRVLFVCTPNAARSQMAEALLRHLRPNTYEVFSADTEPTKEDFDIDTVGLCSKPIEQFRDESFDFVIALCTKSQAECQTMLCDGKFIAWDIVDPQTADIPNASIKALNEIQQRSHLFLLVTERERNNHYDHALNTH